MGRGIALSALLVTSCLVSGAADARRAARCAQPEEMTAVETAAVQQELMVAALTCHEVARFNAFQTDYGAELRASDARLASMFRRLYGARGEARYHAFKTKLANDSSMRSIHNNPVYCQEASAMFATALEGEHPRLAAFVHNANVVIAAPPAQDCSAGTRVAGEVRVLRRHRHRRVAAAQ